jgi:hypothetical protein
MKGLGRDSGQRVLNNFLRIRLSSPPPSPSLVRQQVVSLSQTSCVSTVELTDGRGLGGGSGNQIIAGTPAWSSGNLNTLWVVVSSWGFLFHNAAQCTSCGHPTEKRGFHASSTMQWNKMVVWGGSRMEVFESRGKQLEEARAVCGRLIWLKSHLLHPSPNYQNFAKFVTGKKRSNTHSSIRGLFYAVRSFSKKSGNYTYRNL